MRKNQVWKIGGFVAAFFFVILFVGSSAHPASALYERKKYLSINSGASDTISQYVTLSIGRPFSATHMRLGNDMESLSSASWIPYKSKVSWTLPFQYGERTVYVQFQKDDRHSYIYEDSIFFREPKESEKNKKYIKINGNDKTTKYLRVRLSITVPPGFTRMRVSNKAEDLLRMGWRNIKRSMDWDLAYGGGNTKTVYLQFQDQFGVEGPVYSDSIDVKFTSNVDLDFQINEGAVQTDSRAVTLTFTDPGGVVGVKVNNSNDFKDLEFVPIQQDMPWILSEKSGTKTVYVRYQDFQGGEKTTKAQIRYEEPEAYIEARSLIKSPNSHVYFVGFDGKVHPFLSPAIYHSWYSTFEKVRFVSDAKLAEYPVGEPMCARPGSWLLQFGSDPKIYAIEPACRLRPLFSEVEAVLLYGENWGKRILKLSPDERVFYTIITQSVHEAEAGVYDTDHDGVDDEMEKNYGSNPNLKDTDGDKLTDYEEIFIWFTDPVQKDTDFDGVGDADEILSGRLPTGPTNFDTLPDNAVEYPEGSLVNKVNASTSISGVRKQFLILPKYYLPKSIKDSIGKKNTAHPLKEYNGLLIRL
ncbi:hypothetical protein H6758_02665 [Candidatus Nomurabacteria bacterium]|nr:hypothetical protein [Candidatus Nomurabacteria bacterium]